MAAHGAWVYVPVDAHHAVTTDDLGEQFLHLICRCDSSSKQTLHNPRLSSALMAQLGITVRFFRLFCGSQECSYMNGSWSWNLWGRPRLRLRSLCGEFKRSFNRSMTFCKEGGRVWNGSLRGISSGILRPNGCGDGRSSVNPTVDNANRSPGSDGRTGGHGSAGYRSRRIAIDHSD